MTIPVRRVVNSAHRVMRSVPTPNYRVNRDMTYEEKQKLSCDLQGLPSEKLNDIVEIIVKMNPWLRELDHEIEVDIDSLVPATLWELYSFVTDYKNSLSKNKSKVNREMTYEEKKRLSTDLLHLPSEKLDNVVKVIRKGYPVPPEEESGELKVDVDSLDTETLWELRSIVTDHKKSLRKNKRKTEFARRSTTAEAGQDTFYELETLADLALKKLKQLERGEILSEPSGSGSSSSDSDSDNGSEQSGSSGGSESSSSDSESEGYYGCRFDDDQ